MHKQWNPGFDLTLHSYSYLHRQVYEITTEMRTPSVMGGERALQAVSVLSVHVYSMSPIFG